MCVFIAVLKYLPPMNFQFPFLLSLVSLRRRNCKNERNSDRKYEGCIFFSKITLHDN